MVLKQSLQVYRIEMGKSGYGLCSDSFKWYLIPGVLLLLNNDDSCNSNHCVLIPMYIVQYASIVNS